MEKINEDEARERYNSHLDETKEYWMKNYHGADVLKKIDESAFNVGFTDFCDGEDFEVEED